MNRIAGSFIVGALVVFGVACVPDPADTTARNSNVGAVGNPDAGGPGKNFTAADVAKLKWIEGTWKGMDGDKPFYERYKIDETAMIVEGLNADGTPDGEPGRFELNEEGEFGKGEGDERSAATEITSRHVEFVPALRDKRNTFRFVRQEDGTWHAVLDFPASSDKPARQKIYKMEKWEPPKK